MPRILGIRDARAALWDGSGIGQSFTEVRDEAVAGKEAAAASTVAWIASGASWVGGSERGGGWKREGWELSVTKQVSELRTLLTEAQAISRRTDSHEFAIYADVGKEMVEAAFEVFDRLNGRVCVGCRRRCGRAVQEVLDAEETRFEQRYRREGRVIQRGIHGGDVIVCGDACGKRASVSS